MAKQTVEIRLSKDTIKAIAAIAKLAGVSKSTVANVALAASIYQSKREHSNK